MSGRRIALPGANELFRSTGSADAPADLEPDNVTTLSPTPSPVVSRPQLADLLDGESAGEERDASVVVRRRPRSGERRPTGRERHDEKITVYVSAEELIDLERARLTLRGDHGLAVDRGRIVREALSMVLADLEGKGDQSYLVRRLRGR